jgi:predicted ATPase
MCPVTLRAYWVASTKRCKDAGLVHSSAMDEAEDAAARRVIASQEARGRRRVHH